MPESLMMTAVRRPAGPPDGRSLPLLPEIEDSADTLPRPALVSIRQARPGDLAELAAMVALLAAHHGDGASLSAASLRRDLFGPTPWITALVAAAPAAPDAPDAPEAETAHRPGDPADPADPADERAPHRLIGYAILLPLYRATEGQRGMDLHHLFVRDGQRGNGIGQHLVARARDLARQAGCSFLSVSAATGNVAAHRFYEQLDFAPRPVTGMRYLQRLPAI